MFSILFVTCLLFVQEPQREQIIDGGTLNTPLFNIDDVLFPEPFGLKRVDTIDPELFVFTNFENKKGGIMPHDGIEIVILKWKKKHGESLNQLIESEVGSRSKVIEKSTIDLNGQKAIRVVTTDWYQADLGLRTILVYFERKSGFFIFQKTKVYKFILTVNEDNAYKEEFNVAFKYVLERVEFYKLPKVKSP